MHAGKITLRTLEDVSLKTLKCFAEENGTLIPLEAEVDSPFAVARLFYICDVTAGAIRGQHAHKSCRQFIICQIGSVKVMCDDGNNKSEWILKSPNEALYIPPTIWATQTYLTDDTLALVLADQHFDPGYYIRDYHDFLQFRRENEREKQ